MASSPPVTLSSLTPTRTSAACWVDFLKAEVDDVEEEGAERGNLRARTDLSLYLNRSLDSEPHGKPSPLSSNLTRLCAVNCAISELKLAPRKQSMEMEVEITAHGMKRLKPSSWGEDEKNITCARKSSSPHIFPAHFTSYLWFSKILFC